MAESDHKKVFVKDFSNVQIVGEGHFSGYKGLMQQLKTLFSSRLNSLVILLHPLYFYRHIFSSDTSFAMLLLQSKQIKYLEPGHCEEQEHNTGS